MNTADDSTSRRLGPTPAESYKTLTEREWELIAKDPDAHVGETIVVYGVVTQFDNATGDDRFRADIGHTYVTGTFDYPTNSMLTASASKLKDLVKGNEFRAQVRVAGSLTYDTQSGGNTTAPLLFVDLIKVL